MMIPLWRGSFDFAQDRFRHAPSKTALQPRYRTIHPLPQVVLPRYTSAVRVGLDMRRINAFGVGTYVRNVVRALAQLDSENEYFLIGPGNRQREFGDLPPNFVSVPLLEPAFPVARPPMAVGHSQNENKTRRPLIDNPERKLVE